MASSAEEEDADFCGHVVDADIEYDDEEYSSSEDLDGLDESMEPEYRKLLKELQHEFAASDKLDSEDSRQGNGLSLFKHECAELSAVQDNLLHFSPKGVPAVLEVLRQQPVDQVHEAAQQVHLLLLRGRV